MDSLDPIVLHCNVHWKLQFIVWTMILAEKDNDWWKVMCVGRGQRTIQLSATLNLLLHRHCTGSWKMHLKSWWLIDSQSRQSSSQPTNRIDLKKWKYGRKVCKETHIVIVSNILSISCFSPQHFVTRHLFQFRWLPIIGRGYDNKWLSNALIKYVCGYLSSAPEYSSRWFIGHQKVPLNKLSKNAGFMWN